MNRSHCLLLFCVCLLIADIESSSQADEQSPTEQYAFTYSVALPDDYYRTKPFREEGFWSLFKVRDDDPALDGGYIIKVTPNSDETVSIHEEMHGVLYKNPNYGIRLLSDGEAIYAEQFDFHRQSTVAADGSLLTMSLFAIADSATVKASFDHGNRLLTYETSRPAVIASKTVEKRESLSVPPGAKSVAWWTIQQLRGPQAAEKANGWLVADAYLNPHQHPRSLAIHTRYKGPPSKGFRGIFDKRLGQSVTTTMRGSLRDKLSIEPKYECEYHESGEPVRWSFNMGGMYLPIELSPHQLQSSSAVQQVNGTKR